MAQLLQANCQYPCRHPAADKPSRFPLVCVRAITPTQRLLVNQLRIQTGLAELKLGQLARVYDFEAIKGIFAEMANGTVRFLPHRMMVGINSSNFC